MNNTITFNLGDYNNQLEDFEIDELKQYRLRLRLSYTASRVIANDMRDFENNFDTNHPQTFLNHLFTQYYHYAKASVHEYCFTERKHWENRLNKDDSTVAVLDQLFSLKEQECCDWIKASNNTPLADSVSYSIELNHANLVILKNSFNAKYYEGKVNKYLKAVFEEYALLPSYEREHYYFNDSYATINQALDNHKCLEIVFKSAKGFKTDKYTQTFRFYPYKIVQDKNCIHNYLVGYSEKRISSQEYLEPEIHCIRLSHIEEIHMRSKHNALTSSKKKRLDTLLREREIPYFGNDPQPIRVQFTPEGLRLFKVKLFNRPDNYQVIEEDIYEFNCSLFQAKVYFFSFGREIKILFPLELAEDFALEYQEAYNRYS